MHEVSETLIDWPNYQIPYQVTSAVASRSSLPPPVWAHQSSRMHPMAAAPNYSGEQDASPEGVMHRISFWILVMLFVLQIVVVGIVADVHVQQRHLMNILILTMSEKKFGVASSSIVR